MSDGGLNFDLQSGQRIGATVRAVEGWRGSPPDDELRGNNDEGWEFYWVKVISATRDEPNWRWGYDLRPQVKIAAGHGGWSNHPRFSATVPGFNNWEDDNGSTGTVSGYELDDGSNETRIIGLQPIATGLVTLATVVRFFVGSTLQTEWRICVQNTPIVECS